MNTEPKESSQSARDAEQIALDYATANRLQTYPHDLANAIATALEAKNAEIEKLSHTLETYATLDEVCGEEFEGLDTATDVLRCLKQERDTLRAEVERLSEKATACEEMERQASDHAKSLKDEVERLKALAEWAHTCTNHNDEERANIKQRCPVCLKRQLNESIEALIECEGWMRCECGHSACKRCVASKEAGEIIERFHRQQGAAVVTAIEP